MGFTFNEIIERKTSGRVFRLSLDDGSVGDFIQKIRSYLRGPQVRGEMLVASPLIEEQPSSGSACQSTPPFESIYSGVHRLELIIRILLNHSCPLVAVIEDNHVDNVYRNAFYHWYSRRMSNTPRFTLRVSFFSGKDFGEQLSDEIIYSSKDDVAHYDMLKKSFRGSVVVYPLGGGLLGRTIISPADLVEEPVHVRLSEFELKVFGRKFTVDAFPFRMQDTEMMSCAETTLLNMLEYFSSRYQEYAMALPNDIIELEEAHSSERAVPTRGINYSSFSQLLGNLGFFPRLLSLYSLQHATIGLPGYIQFRRYLYWYLGSGIPAAVNVAPPTRDQKGHSLAIVGFTDCRETVVEAVKRHLLLSGSDTAPDEEPLNDTDANLVNSTIERMSLSGLTLAHEEDAGMVTCRIFQEADFPRSLVTVDDAQLPYQILDYAHLSPNGAYVCENMVFPLHRGMALDAQDAYEMFKMILEDEHVGALSWGKDFIEDDEPIIMRMFLVTAGSYRGFRARTTPEPLRYLFEAQTLPHFVWVAELVHMRDYVPDPHKLQSFAEIVLDATAGRRMSFEEKLLLMRYPGRLAWREPADPEESFGDHTVRWTPDDSDPARASRFRSYPFALRDIEPRYE